ncbi:hypothetical protein ASJ81_08130 [Methanosarcina spelaei]|uniref:Uncharacterized protein n=1 Tax=Methanosarcina spelaei TaxID=1036679 RepID=A0A2A2HRZ9_9EURY|nr:hypothetical protein [Methanosarcina spelaei]PAV11994.1 hypothetical protein ASJ81_08130 [Methanosarcina spelaei]
MDPNISNINVSSISSANFQSILTLIVAIFGSGSIIGIFIQNKITKLRSIEEKLIEDRRKVYFDLLAPFILMFTKGTDQQKITDQMLSQEYRRTSFELTLLGSDKVVRAYGNLMQYTFESEKQKAEGQIIDPTIIIKLYTTLLLEIRKDLGNGNTSLKEKDMISHMITDIDKLNF